ncbi:hypothetical protein HHI36_017694 [Cryptolaemus montrouzieri]|uniref:Acyl-CoA synthetase family member 3, mitochondrial n=1 Tax=Cryptolaemus montrouzieri TaxID=559131 RepID=A0ABD2NNJ3_9CUCU
MLIKYLKRIKKTQITGIYRYVQTQISPPLPNNSEDIVPCFKQAEYFMNKVALRDAAGTYSYANIYLSARELAEEITQKMMGRTNERILFMCPNNVNYVISLWAIWMSGQIAVPLSPLHPQNLLLYYINDALPQMLITSSKFQDLTHKVAKNTNTPLLVLDDNMQVNCAQKIVQKELDFEAGMPDHFYTKNDALILYTSGTTGNPKGVVLSHRNLCSQINMLLNAWKWSSSDVILHTLPLNHVHGIVNALLCPLTVGAKTVMLPKFDANSVWTYLLGIQSQPDDRKINVYMAVPTIYCKLIEEYEKVFSHNDKMKDHIKNVLKSKVRLMVSGSAPLPESIFAKWSEITGHDLLERYGMTEIGMCLSNPYETKREPGYVGKPLPGVSVKIAQKDISNNYSTLLRSSNIDGRVAVDIDKSVRDTENPTGHLLVKSDGIFKEYFNRMEATKKSFTDDNYFITGDICQYDTIKRSFKILGRESVDIIKSGGYKLSALQIETQLLNNKDIKECAVVGIPDEKWGQKVAAIVVLNKDKTMTLESLKSWSLNKLPKYSTPSVLRIVESIPKIQWEKLIRKNW